MWRCVSRLEHGTKYCKHSPALDEERIHTAIAGALGEMVSEKEFFMQTQKDNLRFALSEGDADTYEIKRELEDLDIEFNTLMENIPQDVDGLMEFDKDMIRINDRRVALKAQLAEYEQEEQLRDNQQSRICEMMELMDGMGANFAYDDTLVARVISTVTVDVERIRVMCVNGVEVEQRLV